MKHSFIFLIQWIYIPLSFTVFFVFIFTYILMDIREGHVRSGWFIFHFTHSGEKAYHSVIVEENDRTQINLSRH